MCTLLGFWLLYLHFIPFRKKAGQSKYFGVEACSQIVEQGWLLGPGNMGKTAPWKSFYIEFSILSIRILLR